MNHLQEFMRECNRQTRTPDASGKVLAQEEAIINGSKYWGVFGQATIGGEGMVRHGYDVQLVHTFTAAAEQFATPPQPRQNVTRCLNNVVFFAQEVDNKNPLVFTFILLDREP